jgi:hypothetical protein
LINVQHSASTTTLARLLQEVNSPGRVLKLREEQLIRILSNSSLSAWIGLDDNIGSLQVILKTDIETIRWQVLKQYYQCSDAQARAIAEGGQDPIYSPEHLITQVQQLKKDRTQAKPDSLEYVEVSGKSDLIQRMELSAALVEAGMRT